MPTFTATTDTYLKQSFEPATSLDDHHKVQIKQGSQMQFSQKIVKNDSYFTIIFPEKVNGYYNWLAFNQHFTFDDDLITSKQLFNMTNTVGYEVINKYAPLLNCYFNKYQVNTPLRVAHFLAQVLHESGEFFYTEEIADGSDYENRSDLGNFDPGDGVKYKGRGLIQVTGKANYSQISKDVGFDYVSNPTKLAQLPDAVLSAFWFWNTRNLSKFADADNFDAIALSINGGYNGFDSRLSYLRAAKKSLGI